MAPRGFTNPAPKTDSARSALSSFTCTLCNKSYSRHPEYEAHIGSYDHQHRKRLQDLKQLSRDPNAAERARKAEKKADAEAGLRVLDKDNNNQNNNASTTSTGNKSGSGGGGGFKKGGFKSSFTTVKGPAAPVAPTKKNVLGDEDEDDNDNDRDDNEGQKPNSRVSGQSSTISGGGHRAENNGGGHHSAEVESDTDDDYQNDTDGAYYDPQKPTGCSTGCPGARAVTIA